MLQTCLALIWLLDAALQCQPVMFTTGFTSKVIGPAEAGNPAVISVPISWAAQLMAKHIFLWNTGAILIEFAIAAGLLLRGITRAALAVSIAWSLAIWWFGEGLGGVLAGAGPLTGAPGPAILYALIAVLIWPPAGDPPEPTRGRAPALRGPLGPLVPKLAWLTLWTYSGLAGLTAGRGPAGSVALTVLCVLAVLCVLTGLGVLTGPLTRPALGLGCLLALLFWLAQGFGGLATGTATDPGTGPLLILLAACFWPPRRVSPPPAGSLRHRALQNVVGG